MVSGERSVESGEATPRATRRKKSSPPSALRDHKVVLRIRRRRWTDTRTGKSFSIPIDLDIVAKGTRYSKEFGAFLKETYGDVPSDLPYT